MHVILNVPLDDHKPGETVELLDHHAQNLIDLGFAEPAPAKVAPKTPAKASASRDDA
jgi:hypothetical protein